MKIEHCRSCNAEIVWAWTAANKSMPVDAAPTDAGTLRLLDLPTGPRVEVIADPDQWMLIPEVGRYTSHFATCPQADRWRTR